MNMGEPVVGWAKAELLEKEAANATRLAAIFVGAATLILVTDHTVMRFVAPAAFALCGAMFGWLAWLYRRVAKEGAGALQARVDGDDVILGTAFSMAIATGKRFANGDTLTLSVATRVTRRRLLSEWTIVGTGAAVVAKSLGTWTEEQWYELATGLQRLGFTVVAGPDAAGSHASAHGG
jgi:hypothetical protein